MAADATVSAAAVLPDDPLDLLPADAVVVVAMSGGVDSSVAAARLVERGVRTVGITLAMWPRDRGHDRDRGCCSVDAVEDARRVAAHLGIPHYPWDLEDVFTAEVVDDYAREYAAGRTPNPCLRCNDRVKFGVLWERARAVGATHLATGHYARIGARRGRVTLHRGADPRKDQAYTLYRLGQDRLRTAVFPVGAFPGKDAVRAEARRVGLHLAAKADSQELCFVEGRVREDLERRLAGRFAPGPVVDVDGRVVGRHPGLPFHTVGQRAGLGLRPVRPDQPPVYVVALDAAANTVVVGDRRHLDRLEVVADGCAWVDTPPAPGDRCTVQVRAHGEPVDAEVIEAGRRTRLRLSRGAGALAPGQAVVMFDADEVLGGGTAVAA